MANYIRLGCFVVAVLGLCVLWFKLYRDLKMLKGFANTLLVDLIPSSECHRGVSEEIEKISRQEKEMWVYGGLGVGIVMFIAGGVEWFGCYVEC